MDPLPKRLLLVYDGSTVSDRALDTAIARALGEDATVTVLGVVPPRLWRAKRGQFQIPPEKHDEAFAHEQLARAKQRCKDAGVRVETRVRTGPPAHVIEEEVAKGFQVLVMPERQNLTGAPSLAKVLALPQDTEIVAVS
jgi:nucleotide-binding universal stress UspA family protein